MSDDLTGWKPVAIDVSSFKPAAGLRNAYGIQSPDGPIDNALDEAYLLSHPSPVSVTLGMRTEEPAVVKVRPDLEPGWCQLSLNVDFAVAPCGHPFYHNGGIVVYEQGAPVYALVARWEEGLLEWHIVRIGHDYSVISHEALPSKTIAHGLSKASLKVECSEQTSFWLGDTLLHTLPEIAAPSLGLMVTGMEPCLTYGRGFKFSQFTYKLA